MQPGFSLVWRIVGEILFLSRLLENIPSTKIRFPLIDSNIKVEGRFLLLFCSNYGSPQKITKHKLFLDVIT